MICPQCQRRGTICPLCLMAEAHRIVLNGLAVPREYLEAPEIQTSRAEFERLFRGPDAVREDH